ncbi:MAG: class I SAM-dependent methyltransferase [Planctomycetota bacterium]
MTTTPCDVCGKAPTRRIRAIGDTWIVRCRRCGLAFLHPRPTDDQLRRFYTDEYYQSRDPLAHGYEDYDALSPSLEHMAKVKLAVVRSHVKAGKLLDVGAAYGSFVREAARAGFDARGVELSEHAAQIARNRTGAPVAAGDIFSISPSEGPFDAITMWDVLEHTPDARAALAAAADLLAEGGCLFATVPDAASLIARFMGSSWFGFQKLEHTYYFTPRTITSLLRDVGLEDVRCHAASWSCTASYIARRLAHYNSALAAAALALLDLAGLADATIDFRWIDMLVTARKPGKGGQAYLKRGSGLLIEEPTDAP